MIERALADTSIFVAGEADRPLDTSVFPDELGVSIITIGELRAGVLAASVVDIRDRRLRTLTNALSFDPLPVDIHVAQEWARLRVLLRDQGLRMGVNDSWIAATALAHQIPVLTQGDGFPDIGDLVVIRA